MNNIKLYHTIERDLAAFRAQPKPPTWLLDKLADEKHTGKYTKKANKQCTVCYELKSVSGDCGCTV